MIFSRHIPEESHDPFLRGTRNSERPCFLKEGSLLVILVCISRLRTAPKVTIGNRGNNTSACCELYIIFGLAPKLFFKDPNYPITFTTCNHFAFLQQSAFKTTMKMTMVQSSLLLLLCLRFSVDAFVSPVPISSTPSNTALHLSSIPAPPLLVSGVNIDLTPAIESYVDKRIGKTLEKLSKNGAVRECDVILSVNKNPKVRPSWPTARSSRCRTHSLTRIHCYFVFAVSSIHSFILSVFPFNRSYISSNRCCCVYGTGQTIASRRSCHQSGGHHDHLQTQ